MGQKAPASKRPSASRTSSTPKRRDAKRHGVKRLITHGATSPVVKAITRKMDEVLAQEQAILQNENAIKQDERRIGQSENDALRLEQRAIGEEKKEEDTQHDELSRLESLETEIKKDALPHPLARVTLKDLAKGIVGSFVGVVVHFTFTYGVELAANISVLRATLLMVLSFIIGSVFLYATGFRKISDKNMLWLLPYRMGILFLTAIVVTVFTLWFFYPNFIADPSLAYRQVAVVNLSAIIGACTADLIGRE